MDHVKPFNDRIIGLDLLRSIAILLVVFLHGSLLLPKCLQERYLGIVYIMDGVSIFFVLSGFLIGGILLRVLTQPEFTILALLNFWIRRWFRTIPNYLLVLCGLLFFRECVFKNPDPFPYQYFFFSQNFSSRQPTFFAEAWSLAIEEWFYLLFPATCYFLTKILKKGSAVILYSAVIFITIPLALRILKYEMGIGINDIEEEFRKIAILRLDSLMYGIIGAYICYYHKALWGKYRDMSFFLGVFIVIFMRLNTNSNWIKVYQPIYFNIESISVLLVVPFFSELKTTRIVKLDLLFVFISTLSYSMYLLNLTPVIHHLIPLTNTLLGTKGLPIEEVFVHNYILYWFYTMAGSYLLYHCYENRMTRLRNRIKLGLAAPESNARSI
jgi:peptidoglycan/LPS O-acetylase OafA/YrhL